MSVDFEAYGDHGRLQFSASSPMLVFAAKGTHFASSNGYFSVMGWKFTQLNIGGLSASHILSIVPRGDSFIAFHYSQTYSGGRSYFFYTAGTDPSFDWYAFDVPNLNGAINAGLQLYNESGVLCYQLNTNPMRLVGTFQQNIGPGSTGPQSLNVPGGRTYALAFGMRSGIRQFFPIGTPDGQPDRYSRGFYADAVTLSSNVLTVNMQRVERGTFFYTDPSIYNRIDYYGPRNDIIIDVTGY